MSEKVLIAEDDDNIRQLVKITLTKPGREVLEAPDGLQALDLAFASRPDLVILDVMMPGMTGYQVGEALRKDPRTASVRIMFLTARSGAPAETAMKKAGADYLHHKPFVPSELKARVETILSEPAPSAKPGKSAARP